MHRVSDQNRRFQSVIIKTGKSSSKITSSNDYRQMLLPLETETITYLSSIFICKGIIDYTHISSVLRPLQSCLLLFERANLIRTGNNVPE
jgi:hypothetical protein